MVPHKPRLLSDKDPGYIAGELAECTEARIVALVDACFGRPAEIPVTRRKR